MTARVSPYALVFGALAPRHFPAVRTAVGSDALAALDRDRFVLLGPVGQLLRELAPDDTPPEALEAHVRLVHHAYRHWAAGAWVYDVSAERLSRAAAAGPLRSTLPHDALYLRLPTLRVWGAAQSGEPPEPLDGMFLAATAAPGTLAALGIFGMHGERPGFSAVAVEGHADAARARIGEIEIPTEREDGSPALAPQLAGGAAAAVYSVADAGELLLLACRLLHDLPAPPVEAGSADAGPQVEHIVAI